MDTLSLSPRMGDMFSSPRLIYRALEPEDDDFVFQMQQDSSSWLNYANDLPTPKTKQSAGAHRRLLQGLLLCVVICITRTSATSLDDPPEPPAQPEPIPIGLLTLGGDGFGHQHHRRASLGIMISQPYQSQGYGSEAIRWCLQWGFKTAGLHKIWLCCSGWNEGALRLYSRLGFKEEGVLREHVWFDGRWEDDVQFGMLEREWREIQGVV